MPNKPFSQGYRFFCMAENGYVWEFHSSSNAVGGDPGNVESCLLWLRTTGKMVHHLCYVFGVTGILPESYRISS
jgi:hypothetical protein